MATLNINDANTRTVTFNGNTVEKIILNGTTTWVKRPTPSAATFSCPVKNAGNYYSVSWKHSTFGSTRTSYVFALSQSTYRTKPYYWIVGRGIHMATQGEGQYGTGGTIARPTLVNAGNGYYVGDTYNMRLPTTISRGGRTYTTKSHTGAGTALPMKFKVKSVTTPFGDVSSTNGVFGSIKTWETVSTVTGRNATYKWGQYKFSRSGAFLISDNASNFTLTGTADVPSYKD